MEAINSLGINAKLLIAQIINFVVLLLLLKKFLYGPIVKMLDGRSATIKKSLEDAKQIEEDLKQTSLKNDQILTEAREQAKKMIEDAKKSANDESKRLIAEAEKRAEEQKAKALLDIAESKESAKAEIKAEAANLIALATEKIVQQRVDAKVDNQIIQESIKSI